ncbi:MAG: stringent starvation protein A [Gammaproteobacteria bacterium]|nr:MAG: stringent starvation protein A [Gammaproteobacteria bacterium]
MLLYSGDSCLFSHRVRFLAKIKKMTLNVVSVNLDDLPEDLLQLNPYGTVPTLLERRIALYDSRVIIDHLDERYPHPPLMPVEPLKRARMRLALYRIERDWYSLIEDIEGKSERKSLRSRKSLAESLQSSQQVFSIRKFFLSDDMTLVDVSLAPLLWRIEKYGIRLNRKECEPMFRYMDRLFAIPGFTESLTPSEQDMR